MNIAITQLQQEASATGSNQSFENIAAVQQKIKNMMHGVESWQSHPYRRNMEPAANIWSNGSTVLFDYGQTKQATNPTGPPVLVIPSLVNKSYILDLTHRNSLLRTLASAGLRPFLLDWGAPKVSEYSFDVHDYITNRVSPALNIIQMLTGKTTGLLGYCMGGTIAAAVSLLSGNINSLATIGAPWDFQNHNKNRLIMHLSDANNLDKLLDHTQHIFGAIPFDFMQYIFAAIEPIRFADKFQYFQKLEMLSPRAEHFVAVEDWLADGVSITGPVAKDLLSSWHINNQIIRGNWQVNNVNIDATKIRVPGLFVCGQRDSIAPLQSTLALPNLVKQAKVIQPDLGHVGMIVGSHAINKVINPIADFLLTHAKG